EVQPAPQGVTMPDKRALRLCTRYAEACVIARQIVDALRTYRDAAKLVGLPFVRELLPPERTMQSEIDDSVEEYGRAFSFRSRVFAQPTCYWRKCQWKRVLDAAVTLAVQHIRDESKRAGLTYCEHKIPVYQARSALRQHLCPDKE